LLSRDQFTPGKWKRQNLSLQSLLLLWLLLQQVWQQKLDIQKIVDFASTQGRGNSIRGGGDLRPQ